MNMDLKDRTKRFALGVLSFSTQVPQRNEMRHIVQQLLRSSSSVAANYRAACRARSRSEFVAKLGVVEEECDEAQFWMEFLHDSVSVLGEELNSKVAGNLAALIKEADELVRIVVASKKTARERQ
jgi:four helix bundle protein